MEFPNLGRNCQQVDCKTLDLLPITCSYCNKAFCKNHFFAEAHGCTNALVASCPEEHSVPKNYKCSFEECITTDVVAMLCVQCRLHYCLNHRYHKCFENSSEERAEARRQLLHQKEKVAETFKKVADKIDENIEKSKKSGKYSATALKVQLMRLKGKAKGEKNIPETSRVHFLIYPPKQLGFSPKPVYVSNDWTIGRVIDSISSLVDADNRNNEANSSKLRLFKKSDGLQLSCDMSDKLGTLIQNGAIDDGGSLILEYVKPEFSLIDYSINCPSSYK